MDAIFPADYPLFNDKGTPLCATVDPEAFFPDVQRKDRDTGRPQYTGSSAEVKLAKKMCVSCPYIEECLEFALNNNELYGIWGGLTYQERRMLKRRRQPKAV